jgi:hypothetical protein
MDEKINSIFNKLNEIKRENNKPFLSRILNIFIYYLKIKLVNLFKLIIYYENIIDNISNQTNNANENPIFLKYLQDLILMKI